MGLFFLPEIKSSRICIPTNTWNLLYFSLLILFSQPNIPLEVKEFKYNFFAWVNPIYRKNEFYYSEKWILLLLISGKKNNPITYETLHPLLFHFL
jgi:hypothetical protein